ncbi:hypothetical protein BDB00DRAFT_732142, partial [Zychaea mexicana]|uniref:uncharacterized protein n=1 Tax=Zychaea mexicana TaxID=64656 RepID=UPI0022FE076D
VRIALFNIACDFPVARKVGEFTSHCSTGACNKYTREFLVLPGTTKLDYSAHEIDRANGLRTREGNAQDAQRWRDATTHQGRYEVERGMSTRCTRWSHIHRLRYFSPARSTVIDPMHNLFLGTADRMVRIWRSHGLLTDADGVRVQVMADALVLPPGVSSLQRKIDRKFGFMTADDWKAWTLVCSPFVLR